MNETEMNPEAIRLIDAWCKLACTDIDRYFKWMDALEFILADYESEKFLGLYLLPDGSQVFPNEVQALRVYAAKTLKHLCLALEQPEEETTLSANERNPGLS